MQKIKLLMMRTAKIYLVIINSLLWYELQVESHQGRLRKHSNLHVTATAVKFDVCNSTMVAIVLTVGACMITVMNSSILLVNGRNVFALI